MGAKETQCSDESSSETLSQDFSGLDESHDSQAVFSSLQKKWRKKSVELMMEWFSQELLQMAIVPDVVPTIQAEMTAGIAGTAIPQLNKLGTVFPGLWIIFLVSEGCFSFR